MKVMTILLCLALAAAPVMAETAEAQKLNYWTEFDITFWQTLPFAAFWSLTIASQLSPGAVEWSGIFAVSAGVALANAAIHAKKTAAARSR